MSFDGWECPCDQCNGRIESPEYVGPCLLECSHGVCSHVDEDGSPHVCFEPEDHTGDVHKCPCGFEWTEARVALP